MSAAVKPMHEAAIRQYAKQLRLPTLGEQFARLAEQAVKEVRIPSDADQRSELMPITIPISCRSPFQSDGDHRSNPMPISSGRE